MNPLRLLKYFALPALALSYTAPDLGLTPEELKHVEGDPKVTNFVTFEITLFKTATEFEVLGEMKFALFGELLPMTVANFIATCEMAEYGYKNSVLHRVVKEMIFQGGYMRKTMFKEYDPLPYDKFKQENFDVLHNKPGRISLPNTGGDTNGASFFISIAETTTFFDGKYVAFGQLVSGFPLINMINDLPVSGETPLYEIVLTKVTVTDVSMPVVVFIGNVTKEYLYFIYMGIVFLVVLVIFRIRRRRLLVDIKSFKL